MNGTQLANEGQEKISDAAVDYEEVDLASEDYKPSNPFRSVHVGDAGDLVIVSAASGRKVTFKVTAGVWPFSGRAIIKEGTTASSIVALF